MGFLLHQHQTRKNSQSEKYNFNHLKTLCHFNLGELHFFMKDLKTAKIYFNIVLKRAEDVNSNDLIPEVYKYFVLINFRETCDSVF